MKRYYLQRCEGYDADCNAEMVEDNQGDWVEHDEIQSHLSLLAEAVLEAHNKPTEYGPWAGNDDMEPCPCTACKLAREVMG